MNFKETLKKTKKTIFVILILIMGFGPAKIAKAGSSISIVKNPVTYTRLIIEVQNPIYGVETEGEDEVYVLGKRKRS